MEEVIKHQQEMGEEELAFKDRKMGIKDMSSSRTVMMSATNLVTSLNYILRYKNMNNHVVKLAK